VVVCHCERVSDRQVRSAVEGGCASLSAVCERTGAGQGCGSCLSSVKMILDQHSSPREASHATA
jgi:bacterioferritin-associated ferredoxin